MTKYICKVCDYVYDEENGIPDADIKPGRRFKDLPDNWECPVCYVGKSEFRELTE